MSNKLRLAIVLPCIQVLLAFALLRAASHQRLPRGWDTPHTSDAALVCVGISAPAFPLITSYYAAFLGLLSALLTIHVIINRVKTKVDYGDGGVLSLGQAMRAHGLPPAANFTSLMSCVRVLRVTTSHDRHPPP